jgi:copper chaperone NosL
MIRPLVLSVVLVSGCERESSGPASIALGEDACDTCRMIISEPPHAAQARFGDSRVEKYDDVGCLLARGEFPPAAWVTDHASGRWTDARRATYVHAKDWKTPMASGLAAFARREEAEAFAAARGGHVLTFEDLKGWKRPGVKP